MEITNAPPRSRRIVIATGARFVPPRLKIAHVSTEQKSSMKLNKKEDYYTDGEQLPLEAVFDVLDWRECFLAGFGRIEI